MTVLTNKIDFSVIFSVRNANPNGDPLNGNRPRIGIDGYGEVSDVCLKRKIRNRFLDMDQNVFIQSDDKKNDDYTSLQARADAAEDVAKEKKDVEKYAIAACKEWIDVRSFGQVFAFKGSDLSVGVRGPVSIQTAITLMPVYESDMQITKSVNSIDTKDNKKSSDTMGMKSRIDKAIYRFNGSINCQLAEKTGFTEDDAMLLKEALISLFENDCSSARPDGSMEILKVYWWKHNCKSGQYSSAKVHHSLEVYGQEEDLLSYECELHKLEGLEPEIINGI